MTTIEELKEFGFHCNNMVEVLFPKFYYDGKDITYLGLDFDRNGLDYEATLPYMVRTKTMRKGIGMEDEINNAELVAWYPCQDPNDADCKLHYDGGNTWKPQFLRYKILK